MGSSEWEDLRKQSRHYENEIDMKLVSFSKLGTGYGSREFVSNSANHEAVPLLNVSNADHVFETMSLEIEQLVVKLTEINDKMASAGQASPNAASAHTIQRHREILQDYSKEFQKIKANIQACRDREELLGSVRKDIDSFKNSSGLNRRTEMYLKENDHIRNSERLVDEQIGIAIKTKEDMLLQRSTMKAIQTKMTTLANRFPVISSLIQRINLRKRRDSIILGAVIGVCVILILLYALH